MKIMNIKSGGKINRPWLHYAKPNDPRRRPDNKERKAFLKAVRASTSLQFAPRKGQS